MRQSDFHRPEVRGGVMARLVEDAQRLQASGNRNPILLCFTCDPYMQLEVQSGITRQAIDTLLQHEQPIQILTKGGRDCSHG